jgi:molybdate transport system ATP-binding protein
VDIYGTRFAGMEKIKLDHWTIFLSNNYNKNQLISDLLKGQFIAELTEIKQLKSVLFSELALKEFIEYEDRFGKSEIETKASQSIATLSGGEQKKALLAYCIAQKPDLIILDNPFDNLDIASQKELAELLNNVAKDTILIQLVNRNSDTLPFIEKAVLINEKDQNIIFDNSAEYSQSIDNQINSIFFYKIPEPIKSINEPVDPLVKFKNVTVNYNGRPIVININWQINQNSFWQLIGPNGSGKTTILSMIIGDNPKAFGQDITLFGQKKGTGESVWDLKKNIGYFTPSMTNLFARSTTLQHMIVSGIFDSIGLYNIPSERHLRLATEWLKVIEMDHLSKKQFYKLTVGQQRLAMIARAMVKHPPLLILDEPTAGLDDHNALLVSKLINKIFAESKTTIIFVSHRKEPGLQPQFIYQLTASPTGSTGNVITQID